MTTTATRIGAITLALSIALAPTPSAAIAPALLVLIKQIAQQAAESMIKDMLLSSLSGMGCKGIAMQKAFAAFDLRRSGGGLGGIMGMLGGGMPKLPSGAGLPGLVGGGGGMPGMPGLTGGGGMAAMPGLTGLTALSTGASMSPEITAKMATLMPGIGQMPQGTDIDAGMMAQVQQMMSEPLSPPETLATIDDLTELGFLPKDMQAELKQCMVLLPESAAALGMGMGMLRPMVPQLQQARAELHGLPPAEQDEVAAALVEQVKELPDDQRASLLEYIDTGFFPPRVVAGVKAGLKAR